MPAGTNCAYAERLGDIAKLPPGFSGRTERMVINRWGQFACMTMHGNGGRGRASSPAVLLARIQSLAAQPACACLVRLLLPCLPQHIAPATRVHAPAMPPARSEWGDFSSPLLPTCEEDIWIDCSSTHPGGWCWPGARQRAQGDGPVDWELVCSCMQPSAVTRVPAFLPRGAQPVPVPPCLLPIRPLTV